ncbi:MAG: protein translocase subunit SecF [Gemmatimonadaceae bacterium]|nr:protein translocase subunit SecF [Gemmatimonadaceae bacterium]
MLRILHGTSLDFIKWWRQAAILTVAFIVIGLVSIAWTGGFNYSIEFTGGTMLQLEFKQPPDVATLRGALDAAGIKGAEITQFGSATSYTVRAQDAAHLAAQAEGAENVSKQIEAALAAAVGKDAFTVGRGEAIGPRVGAELRRGAIIAILISFAVTLLYLAWRFEWRFGAAAVLATAHDVLTTIAFIKLLDLEISLTVIAAILTVIGYSLNDTIIIFDRVRENLRKNKREPMYDLLNRSVNETLPRSILTHATTLSATVSLLLLAGEVVRPFAWVMSFGIFTGTFSSIYVASPILLWIERKYPRKVEGKTVAARA